MLLAAVLAATAAALLVPGRGTIADAGPSGEPPDDVEAATVVLAAHRGAAPVTVLGALGLAAGLATLLDGLRLGLALVLGGTAVAGLILVRRGRRARAAERRRAVVVDVAEALVGELRAGQPLLASLQHCVEIWPEMAKVAGAARLGADVPAALRRLAKAPGAEGLAEVASAWQVSERSGAGLAAALAQVAASARARQATRDVVRGELASAQATARLVAVLPFASLAMSAGIGGHPWRFLLATAPGLACLGGGVLLGFLGLLWIDRIAAAVLRG
jgi:tight adherence protein B